MILDTIRYPLSGKFYYLIRACIPAHGLPTIFHEGVGWHTISGWRNSIWYDLLTVNGLKADCLLIWISSLSGGWSVKLMMVPSNLEYQTKERTAADLFSNVERSLYGTLKVTDTVVMRMRQHSRSPIVNLAERLDKLLARGAEGTHRSSGNKSISPVEAKLL
jgi:hypothetical protein